VIGNGSAGSVTVASPSASRARIARRVHGSAQLAHTLLDNDLVDEVRLMVFPVVLGTGKRLFGETGDKKPLRLTDSRVVGDGVAIMVYEQAGPGGGA
jgi:dihydrofolate reductase